MRVLGLEGGPRAVCGHVGVQEGRDLILGVSAGPEIAPGRNTFCRTHRTRTKCIVEGRRVANSHLQKLRCGEGWLGVPDVGRWRDPPLGEDCQVAI